MVANDAVVLAERLHIRVAGKGKAELMHVSDKNRASDGVA